MFCRCSLGIKSPPKIPYITFNINSSSWLLQVAISCIILHTVNWYHWSGHYGKCCLANSFIVLHWNILKCMRQQKAGSVLIVLLRIEHAGKAPRALSYTGCTWIMQCSIPSQMWLFLFYISYTSDHKCIPLLDAQKMKYKNKLQF